MEALFPPGTDLCAIPAAAPPDGQVTDFVNPPTLEPFTIAFNVILNTWTAAFTFGRLYANKHKLGLTDALVTIALGLAISLSGVVISFAHVFRHQWNVPLCLFDGDFARVTYITTVLNGLGLMFAKTATLLLFNQLFVISREMRWAIRAGLAAIVTSHILFIVLLIRYETPMSGQTWDDVMLTAINDDTTLHILSAQGAFSVFIDIYIFILPLPVVLGLKMSLKRRLQVAAVFFTGFLGVIASIAGLAYRVKAGTRLDGMWDTGAIQNCNLAEMDMAIVIASAPSFAVFMRRHVLETKLIKKWRSTLRGSSSSDSNHDDKRDPNQPRTGREDGPRRHVGRGLGDRYYKLSDTWFLKSGASMAAVEAGPSSAEHDENDIRVVSTVDVERATKESSSPV